MGDTPTSPDAPIYVVFDVPVTVTITVRTPAADSATAVALVTAMPQNTLQDFPFTSIAVGVPVASGGQ